MASILLVLALAVQVLPANAQQADSSAAIVNALRQGNNQQALARADQALIVHPADCKFLTLRAVAFSTLNPTQDALQAFEKALASCPQYLPALEGAAQIQYAQQNPAAIPTLKRILALQPSNVTAHAMLASTYRRQNQCGEALVHFEASSALFVNKPEFQQGYGSCLAQKGDFKAALMQYLPLLASLPRDDIRYDVAMLQWKTNDSSDALATLAPLIAAAHYEPAFALGAHIAEESGDTPRAVALLRTAIQLDPDNVNNYLEFSNISFAHKSFQVGIDMIDAGLKRSPNAAPLYLARGVLEVQLSQNDVAIADFDEAHRIDPKLSFATDALGIMQSQQHQDAKSLALFQSEARVHADDPLLQYLLAEQLSLKQTEGDDTSLHAAIAAGERATKLDPGYQPAHDLLATLYLRAKQPKLTIKEAELALAQDPNDEVALFQELMARRRSGDTASIQRLTERLKQARQRNAIRQQTIDRYRLQEEAATP